MVTRALKLHGGVPQDIVSQPNLDALKKGIDNMDKHLDNLSKFGQSVVVAFNRYGDDTEEEIDFVRQHCVERGVGFAVNNAFVEGGKGAAELAELVVKTIDEKPSEPLKMKLYPSPQTSTPPCRIQNHNEPHRILYMKPLRRCRMK